MKLKELKQLLPNLDQLDFVLPDGEKVPSHFHLTELGRTTKDFVDCGGKMRSESQAILQLWVASDYSHRLSPDKLLEIIEMGEKHWDLETLEVQVEFQLSTKSIYGLKHEGGQFHLTPVHTDCLAESACGIPTKALIKAQQIQQSCCNTSDSCC